MKNSETTLLAIKNTIISKKSTLKSATFIVVMLLLFLAFVLSFDFPVFSEADLQSCENQLSAFLENPTLGVAEGYNLIIRECSSIELNDGLFIKSSAKPLLDGTFDVSTSFSYLSYIITRLLVDIFALIASYGITELLSFGYNKILELIKKLINEYRENKKTVLEKFSDTNFENNEKDADNEMNPSDDSHKKEV